LPKEKSAHVKAYIHVAKAGRRMKRFIKGLLSQPAWDLLRYCKYKFLRNNYYALNDLDKKLEKYLNYDNGYFVELGANDGFTQSNTLAFEKKRGWRGVLVEPSPHLFLSCCWYREKSGNKVYCNACVPFDYKEKYVDIDYANVMSVSSSLPTDIKDIERFKAVGKSHLSEASKKLRFGAEAKTLTQILQESESPSEIDLLSLDVEGAELSVLSGIDFGKYKFKFMLIECRDIDRLSKFFSNYGYAQVDKLSYHDYLFSPI
jgi:FkbM family methyltransferase